MLVAQISYRGASGAMIRRALFALICLLISVSGTANAKSAGEIARSVFPSVVLLVMEDDNGQPLSQGSGFFVQRDVVVTNFHVIEGASAGFAKLVGKRGTHEVLGVISVDQLHDLALIKLKGVNGPPLGLEVAGQVAVGDVVFAAGNPLGLEGTFSQGIISGIRHVDADTFLQITAPISPGSSGGPILNSRGQVIGVATASFAGGQNLTFAIPASYVAAALSNSKKLRPLSLLKSRKGTPKRIGIIKGKAVQGVKITHLKWSSYSDITFSVRNLLRQPIKNVKILFVFKDSRGDPIDVAEVLIRKTIPARLAIRNSTSIGRSTLNISMSGAQKFVEIRVLDYQFVR